jgi:hypothetical protein
MEKLRSRARFRTSFWASLELAVGLILPRQSLTNQMPYTSRRSAGPWISKLRKKVLARKRARTSSRIS